LVKFSGVCRRLDSVLSVEIDHTKIK
jgi:hypothetical protein